MEQHQKELQYEIGEDGELHARLSNTAQLDWRDTVEKVEAGDAKRNIAETARVTLEAVLPKQLLIEFEDWFDPEKEEKDLPDVSAETLDSHSGVIGKSPWFVSLRFKLKQMRSSSRKERRDEANPYRANNTMGVLITSAGVFMDQDRLLSRRMMKEGLNPKTTALKLGERAEAWMGEDAYSLLVDNIFRLIELVKAKKIIGQAHQIALEKINKLNEVESPIPDWLHEEYKKTGVEMLMPKVAVIQIYKIGELGIFFLGRDDNNIGGALPEDFKYNLIEECTKLIK